MATQEQAEETLQLFQAQEALIAALKAQLQIESARAQTAEKVRSALIQTLVTIRKKGSGGSGKRNKGQDHKNDVKCWNCGKTGHYARNCSERRCSRGEGKGRPETGTKGCEHADGWTWSDEHVDGLWKKTDWQSPRQRMPTMRLLEC